MGERVSVYIDGFNLYYGIRKSGHKWLDIEQLSRKFLSPDDQLVRIRYFTARVSATPNAQGTMLRQQVYLRALRTLPLVEIHFGRFSRQTKMMPLVNPPPKFAEVIKLEEKGSDVALATFLVADAFRDTFDRALVISNDSDLCPPLQLVQDELGLPITVVNPHSNSASPQIAKMANRHLPILPEHLSASQFPHEIRDAKGIITKPVAW